MGVGPRLHSWEMAGWASEAGHCVRCVLGVGSSFAAAQSSDTASLPSRQLVLVFVFLLLSLMEHFAVFSPVLCRL